MTPLDRVRFILSGAEEREKQSMTVDDLQDLVKDLRWCMQVLTFYTDPSFPNRLPIHPKDAGVKK